MIDYAYTSGAWPPKKVQRGAGQFEYIYVEFHGDGDFPPTYGEALSTFEAALLLV